MRSYELVFIVSPEVEVEEGNGGGFDAVVEKVAGVITDTGGQVEKTDLWGKRHLAYPIRRLSEGYYVVMQVRLGLEVIQELERWLKLSEEVIRYLLVRTEE